MQTPTLETQFNKLQSIEKSLGLFDKSVGNMYYWERIRPRIFRRIRRETLSMGVAHDIPSPSVRIKYDRVKNATSSLLNRNPFLCQTADFAFFHHARRKKMDDGLWWDIYLDPVLQGWSVSDYISLERTYKGLHLQPSKTEKLKYLDFVEIAGLVTNKFCDRFCNHGLDHLALVEKRLYEEFDVGVDLEPFITQEIAKRKVALPQYRQILRRIDPDIAVLTTSGYRKNIIEASKELGITTVEFQHGGGHKFDTCYEYPANVETRLFPDHLFVFGQYWKSNVNYPIPDDRVHVVGFPHHERMVDKYRNVTPKKQIVFASQGPIGEQLSRFAVELDDLKGETEIVYKLHPGEYDRWRDAYPWLVDSEVSVVDDDSPPLYHILAESTVFVGVFSTVVYEAVNMGLETYLVNLPGSCVVKDLVNCDYATLVETPEELADLIQDEREPAQPIFESNSVKKAQQTLHDIYNNQMGTMV